MEGYALFPFHFKDLQPLYLKSPQNIVCFMTLSNLPSPKTL